MTAWKRSLRLPTRLRQRKNITLNLERLEDRLLLNAGFGAQTESNLRADLAHLSEDVAQSSLTLVNDFRSPQTNAQTLGSLANQWNNAMSVLTTDFNQLRQDFGQFRFAILAALGQEVDTWLSDRGIRLPEQNSPLRLLWPLATTSANRTMPPAAAIHLGRA